MNTPAPLPTLPDSNGSPAGWALAVLTAIMGAALVATTWSGAGAAREASASLVRGQGDVLVRSLRAGLRDAPQRPPPPELLARLLDADRDPNRAADREGGEGDDAEGIHYVLVLDPLTGETSSAGESKLGAERVLREARAEERSGHLVTGDDVALLVKRLPPGPEQRARHPQTLVPVEELNRIAIEFTPNAARRLERAALRTLAVGAGATAVLLLTAFAFGRLLRKRARLERDLAGKRQLAALGEMSVVLAHEIRNPLASLKGNAQLLAESLADDGPARRKTDRVVAEAIRLEELCANLLDFVRSAQVTLAPVDVAELLGRCVEAVPEGTVALSLPPGPVTWPLDAHRMEHVIVNLLRNAAQASPPEASVALDARVEDGRLVLAVRDRGPGIPADQEEQIFQPFHTTRTRGTGLGLAVARRVVELHGGTIQASNLPEGGAELVVRLPRAGS